jgi:hypothetical protein
MIDFGFVLPHDREVIDNKGEANSTIAVPENGRGARDLGIPVGCKVLEQSLLVECSGLG